MRKFTLVLLLLGSLISFGIAAEPRDVPVAPVATAATNIAETSFIAHWVLSSGVTDYKIDVATDIGFTSIIPAYTDLSVGILGYYTITGLTTNTPYYYRVRALNASGLSDNSNIIAVNTVGPTDCPIVTSNITVPPNVNGQLNASGATYYSWTPTTGLSNASIANPIVNIPATSIYYVTGRTESTTNLIINGDFEAGNTGFTSAYTYCNTSNCLWFEGYYSVGSNPHDYHNNFQPCTDHTTGSGAMMIINGDVTADKVVWSETINVTPDTYYAFSTWLETVCMPNPAQLQFSINGALVGDIYTAASTTCSWTQFYCIWYSGTNTSVPISIVNKNTVANGNDFAIDDIKFVELCSATNMVIVTVTPPVPDPPVATPATSVNTTSFNANWNTSATATGYRLDVATDAGFTNFVAGYNNLDVGNVITYPVTGLSPGTTYHYRLRGVNSDGPSLNSNIIDVLTLDTPDIQASYIEFPNVQNTQMSVNWTVGNGANRVVFAIQTGSGGSSTALPVNGTTYTANPVFGDGTQIGTSGWYCIYNGNGTDVTVTMLTPNSNYRFMVCEYNGSAGSEYYNTNTAINNPFEISSVPISNWAIFLGLFLIVGFMVVRYRRRLFA
jgi:hypothetical protein